MDDVAYQVEHSVDAAVSPAFAWDWRTDVGNWDDPPAQFQLDGPFATGSWGTTRLPGQEPLRWQIRDVRPGRSFTIEMQLDRATLSFEWRVFFRAGMESKARRGHRPRGGQPPGDRPPGRGGLRPHS